LSGEAAHVVYLHGFASGPRSQKAVIVRDTLEREGVRVSVPDLNLPDFEHLRPSLGIALAAELASGRGPAVVVGSSLGGLMALHVAARSPDVIALVLMAPALRPDERWKGSVGEAGLAEWRRRGARPFYNFVTLNERPIDFGFYEDLVVLAKPPAPRVPVRIVHGRRDEAVPVGFSELYAREHPGRVKLTVVEDGHSLLEHTALILDEIRAVL
jgi:pimeloyl-ACP methyl ester carboxylesterase